MQRMHVPGAVYTTSETILSRSKKQRAGRVYMIEGIHKARRCTSN